MIELNLTITTKLSRPIFTPEIAEQDFPIGINGTLKNFIDDNIELPEDGALLLLTDNAELVKAALGRKLERTHIVFVGEGGELGECREAVADVWNPSEGGGLLKKRYMALLKNLKYRFEAEFYKSTLIATINTVPDMLWYKRLDGIHMLVNDEFTNIVHKTKDDIIGKDHFYIWDAPRPADGNNFACAESEEIAISTGKTYICDEPVKTREGMKQFTTYKTPVYDPFGNVFGTVGVGHDVTNFSNMGIELSILVENLPFPMIIFSSSWEVVRMNSHFADIAGISKEEAEKFEYKKWKAENLTAESEPIVNETTHSKMQEFSMVIGGETKYFRITELEIRDFFDNVSGYFMTMTDLTYQRAYEETIITAANTDTLTGIYNRRRFYSLLSESAGKPMIILYMDLDGFKEVNDTCGHAKGDEVLIQTAELIKAYFPSYVYARLGGDEFIVMADLSDSDNARLQAAKFERKLSEHFKAEGLDVSVSIGFAETDGREKTADELVHEADKKMYEVKKQHHGEV